MLLFERRKYMDQMKRQNCMDAVDTANHPEKDIEQMGAKIDQLESRCGDLQNQLEMAKHEYDKVINSHSWKVTRLLRYVMEQMRRLRHKLNFLPLIKKVCAACATMVFTTPG